MDVFTLCAKQLIRKRVIAKDQGLRVNMNTAELSIAVLSVITVVCAQNHGRCPTWFRPNDTARGCECGSKVEGLIQCNQQTKSVTIPLGFSMTYDNSTEQTVFGWNNFAQYSNVTDGFFVSLPSNPLQLNKYTCTEYNRKGLLCGKCVEGYGPAVHYFTFHCTDCSQLFTMSATALYLVLYLLPMTVLFVLVITFRLNLIGGPMLGYIVFCVTHIVTLLSQQGLYYSIRNMLSPSLQVVFDISNTLSAFWVLQFFQFAVKPFCISEKLEYIHVILFHYLSALYPLLLILMTYLCIHLHAQGFRPIVLLWKPFRKCFVKLRRNWSASDSIIHTFASFMFLSFAGVIFVSFSLALYTEVINVNGTSTKYVLTNAPYIEVLSLQHIPYLLTGLVFLFSLRVCPALLLCLYPTRPFKRLTLCCQYRYRIWINIYADSFQGCYRVGPFGTSFYKMIPSVYMFLLIGVFSSGIPREIHIFQRHALYVFPLFLCQLAQLMNASLTFHTTLVILLIVLLLGFMILGTNIHLLAVLITILMFLPHVNFIFHILYYMLYFLKTHYYKSVTQFITLPQFL